MMNLEDPYEILKIETNSRIAICRSSVKIFNYFKQLKGILYPPALRD